MFNDAPAESQPKSLTGYIPQIPLRKGRSDEVRFDRLLDDLEISVIKESKDASNSKSEDRIETEHDEDNYFDPVDSVFGSDISSQTNNVHVSTENSAMCDVFEKKMERLNANIYMPITQKSLFG